jgi:hypothetical protein
MIFVYEKRIYSQDSSARWHILHTKEDILKYIFPNFQIVFLQYTTNSGLLGGKLTFRGKMLSMSSINHIRTFIYICDLIPSVQLPIYIPLNFMKTYEWKYEKLSGRISY